MSNMFGIRRFGNESTCCFAVQLRQLDISHNLYYTIAEIRRKQELLPALQIRLSNAFCSNTALNTN
jgi:hypothetical protein